MSRFYVGQRVRIVGAGESKFLIGKEAIIRAIDVMAYSRAKGGWYVGHETDAINHAGVTFVGYPYQLEPITDPGRELVSWESCAWKPEHLRERV